MPKTIAYFRDLELLSKVIATLMRNALLRLVLSPTIKGVPRLDHPSYHLWTTIALWIETATFHLKL